MPDPGTVHHDTRLTAPLLEDSAKTNPAVGALKSQPRADQEPVPLRLTVCGQLLALSVSLNIPLAGPIVVGENVTQIEQLVLQPVSFHTLKRKLCSVGRTPTRPGVNLHSS